MKIDVETMRSIQAKLEEIVRQGTRTSAAVRRGMVSEDYDKPAQRDASQAVVVALALSADLKFRQARVALDQIIRGNFGICLECEGRISENRILQSPWAPLCTDCQEDLDRGRLQGYEELVMRRPHAA